MRQTTVETWKEMRGETQTRDVCFSELFWSIALFIIWLKAEVMKLQARFISPASFYINYSSLFLSPTPFFSPHPPTFFLSTSPLNQSDSVCWFSTVLPPATHTNTHTLWPTQPPAHTTRTKHRQKHTRALAVYTHNDFTYTQLPLFPYHRCSNPSLLLSHSPRPRSIQSGFHSALPIPDEQPFTIQLTVINYHHRHYYRDSSTSKAPSKPSHQGELSHGIQILFWCFHAQKQQTTKIAVLTLALISGVICHLKRVTP